MGLISSLSFDLGMRHPLSKEDSVILVISQERKLGPKVTEVGSGEAGI